MFLEVWQRKELRAHFAQVWQTKSLRERETDSKGVAGVLEPEKIEELGDFPDAWQMKGLGEERRDLGIGAFAGGAGRRTFPLNMPQS